MPGMSSLAATTRLSKVDPMALRWWAAFTALAVLFVQVALSSSGFDDEMANMELIEHLGTWATVLQMQHEDVHPPLGYLFNGVLHAATGDWALVRVASAMLYLASLAGFIRFVHREQGEGAAWLALGVAGLSPAALIWCTSLRWYAYFMPLLWWSLTLPADRAGWWYRIKPALAWLIMAHISYAALVMGPVLVLWWALSDRSPWPVQLRRHGPAWALAMLAYIPQAWTLLTVHGPNSAGQTGGLFKSLMGVGISLASNQGLFPISVAGVASALAWLTLYALLGRDAWRRRENVLALVCFTLGVACFVASGLGGKFRNLLLLLPFQAAVLAWGHRALRDSRLAQAAVALVLVGNVVGLVNVAGHVDTTKNSWNLPVADYLRQVDAMTQGCAQPPAVYTFDPVLARATRQRHPDWQVGDYFARYGRHELKASHCTLVLHTYRGALSTERHEALQQAESALGLPLAQASTVGLDPSAALKRKLDPQYPDHPIDIQLYRGQGRADALNRWVLSRR
jgi:hypothetical protein